MVSIFQKMAQVEAREGGDRVPGFLRTHPHSSDRWGLRRRLQGRVGG